MVAGGTGGANTKTGAIFELKTDLKTALKKAGYDLSKFQFCSTARTQEFKRFMLKNGFDLEKNFGQYFMPDEAVIYNNHLYVIEKKTQGTRGSVDEKIATGPYKKLIYNICAKALGLNGATYIFLLDRWFDKPKFTKHKIPYNLQHGIPVYFEEVPLKTLFGEVSN